MQPIIQISSSFHWGNDGAQLMPNQSTNAPFSVTWKSYFPWGSQQVYYNSKLAQILHTCALQQLHPHIVIPSICPRWAGTKIGRASLRVFLKQLAFLSIGYGVVRAFHALSTAPPVG